MLPPVIEHPSPYYMVNRYAKIWHVHLGGGGVQMLCSHYAGGTNEKDPKFKYALQWWFSRLTLELPASKLRDELSYCFNVGKHGEGLPSYRCTSCAFSSPEKARLKNHYMKNHNLDETVAKAAADASPLS